MKKSELKDIIKPIVKECVNESVAEILLESGLLSSVITEVLRGTSGTKLVEESVKKQPTQQNNSALNEAMNLLRQEKQQMIDEMKKKSNNISMKIGNVDVFKNTEPLIAESQENSVADPLSGISPNDPGVDIRGLTSSGKFRMIK